MPNSVIIQNQINTVESGLRQLKHSKVIKTLCEFIYSCLKILLKQLVPESGYISFMMPAIHETTCNSRQFFQEEISNNQSNINVASSHSQFSIFL